jgi:hypothetical protein
MCRPSTIDGIALSSPARLASCCWSLPGLPQLVAYVPEATGASVSALSASSWRPPPPGQSIACDG